MKKILQGTSNSSVCIGNPGRNYKYVIDVQWDLTYPHLCIQFPSPSAVVFIGPNLQ